MAPEFIPFIVCAALLIASAATCAVILLAAISHGVLRRRLQPRFPRAVRLVRAGLMLALVPTLGLLLVTGFCVRQVRQHFFLNEPMAIAASEGDLRKVRVLLDRGASPDSWGIDYVQPAIVGAAENGHVAIVELLLERGANPALRDSRDRSALQLARERGHDDVARLLAGAGAHE